MDQAEAYTDEELSWISDFNLTEEQWQQLRFMFVEAVRFGYRTAVEHHRFKLEGMKREYVPRSEDFSSEAVYCEALNAWRKFNRGRGQLPCKSLLC